MNNVLMVWIGSNPSTMEKNHLVLNGLAKNGVSVSVLGFGMSLESRQYFNQVFSERALYKMDFGHSQLMFQGKNFFIKQMNNIRLSWCFFRLLGKKIKEIKCSVIIMPLQPLELTLPVLLSGKIFGVKIVPNIMEFYPALPLFHRKINVLYRWSWHLMIRYSDAYIVISRFLEEKLSTEKTKPVFRLPAILPELEEKDIKLSEVCFLEGVNAPIFIYTSSQAYDDLLVFCLNSVAEIKDHDFLLVITGKYSSDKQLEWMQIINAKGLGKKVIFSGFLTDIELNRLQRQSVALLIPLLNNERHCARFPQKVLGYMALGKPVITTYVGELAEYFVDSETVYMDKTITAKGYAEKIVLLLESPETATEIGSRGCNVVLAEFSTETWGGRLKSFLVNIEAING